MTIFSKSSVSSSDQPSKKISHLDLDRLSSLPKIAIEAILVRLPIKEAARTSILSREWRYIWACIPDLVFDKTILSLQAYPRQIDYDRKIVTIVNQVLLLHRGPIHKFKLCSYMAPVVEIDGWIEFCSRNGVKELVYDNFKGALAPLYKLPSCLFSCEEIVHLQLSQCMLSIPASFKGFHKLGTLDLMGVRISDEELANLIASSPLLKKLKLSYVDGCTRLKLRVPNLVDLEIGSRFEGICFETTPVLGRGSIKAPIDAECVCFPSGARCKLINVLSCLPGLRRLALYGNTYQVMSAAGVPVKLPSTCQLLHLSLDIESISNKSNKEISVKEFWGAEEDFSYVFGGLRILNVIKYTGTTSEVKFIEFVLANAPVLEVVQINLKGNTDDDAPRRKYKADTSNIYKNLIRFRRLSSKAELQITEPAVRK